MTEAVVRTGAESAEAAVLKRLAERRVSRSSERWLDALINAWESTGKPTYFQFIRGESFDAWGESLAEFDADKLSASPLLRLYGMMSSNPVRATGLAQQTLAARARARTIVDRLWVGALLQSRFIEGEAALASRVALREIHRELAEENPHDFLLVATHILDEGSDEERPLSIAQVRLLKGAILAHREALSVGSLYDELVRLRGAHHSRDREGCFQDACALLPDPLIAITMRAAQTSPESDAHRHELGEVLSLIGSRFKNSRTLLIRMVALAVEELAARLLRDHQRERTVAAERSFVAHRSAAENRLCLGWPIEPLKCEAVDATARDEWSVILRTTFPAAAAH